MNNDDICIHCKRSKEEHYNYADNCLFCFNPYETNVFDEFKSISQHYAELRGPENLKEMKIAFADLSLFLELYAGHKSEMIRAVCDQLQAAIEASKPPKE